MTERYMQIVVIIMTVILVSILLWDFLDFVSTR
jgi:hypothetical protein